MRHRYVWSVALPLLAVGLILGGVCYFFPPDETPRPSDVKPSQLIPEAAGNTHHLHRANDEGPLRCNLFPTPAPGTTKKNRRFDVRVELTNTSDQPVGFWYLTLPHFQLTFLVRDQENNVVKQFHMGALSSTTWSWFPTGKSGPPMPVHTLQPGACYPADFKLSTLQEYLQIPGPGRYRLQARFAAEGHVGEAKQRFVAHSQQVLIEVAEAAEAADEARLRWTLVFE